jgi:DNA-binding beta-propeller fold protein YncE
MEERPVTVRVTGNPTAMVGTANGRWAFVSLRGTASTAQQTVSVVNTAAALARRPAVVGAVRAGLFPRDLSFDRATGQVLVANFTSGTIEEFPVPSGR